MCDEPGRSQEVRATRAEIFMGIAKAGQLSGLIAEGVRVQMRMRMRVRPAGAHGCI